MAKNDYTDPPYRIKNVATIFYGIGSAVLMFMGVVERFAYGHDWGLVLVAVPTAAAIIIKMISEMPNS